MLALLVAANWPEQISLESALSHEMGAGAAAAPGSLPKLWQPGEVWGLGTHATLQQFEQEIGVCFRTQSLQERGAVGWGGYRCFLPPPISTLTLVTQGIHRVS